MPLARSMARRWRRRVTLLAVRTVRRSALDALVRRLVTADVRRTVLTEVYRRANEAVVDELEAGQRWQWHCDPDPCEECSAHCGTSYGRHAEPPPLHPNCRCTALPA